jgi:hypothetical protein
MAAEDVDDDNDGSFIVEYLTFTKVCEHFPVNILPCLTFQRHWVRG